MADCGLAYPVRATDSGVLPIDEVYVWLESRSSKPRLVGIVDFQRFGWMIRKALAGGDPILR